MTEADRRLVALDAAGWLAAPGETAEEFFARVEAWRDARRRFDAALEADGQAACFNQELTLSAADRVPGAITAEAAELTESLYAFENTEIPGFFLSRGVGLLWGGCMIADPEERLSLFLLRNAFRTRRRFLVYGRRELLAHELCHAMRLPLEELTREEFFAYQTSPSRLRRYLGNCFIHERDALLFLAGALLLPAAQALNTFFFPEFPVWPFWILAFLYPAFLLWRNQRARNGYFRALRRLRRFGVKRPAAVLFRVTDAELRALGTLPDAESFRKWAAKQSETELRWRVIRLRFLS